MGFFDSISRGFKSAYGAVKSVTPGILSGITKALAVGRDVIGVSQNVLGKLSTIPVIGDLVKNVAQLPFAVADKALENLQNIDVASHKLGSDYAMGKNLLPALDQYTKSVISAVNLIPNRK